MDAALDGLKELGIEQKDIKTTDYTVWPKYTYESTICLPAYCPPSKQVPDGYTANHSVSVKVRKVKDAGRALALAGEKGATEISGISFTVDDPDKTLNEARAKAIADAKSKAKLLSKELGVRLVRGRRSQPHPVSVVRLCCTKLIFPAELPINYAVLISPGKCWLLSPSPTSRRPPAVP